MSKLTESLEREFEQQRAITSRLLPQNFPDFCKYYFDFEMGTAHREWFSEYFLKTPTKSYLSADGTQITKWTPDRLTHLEEMEFRRVLLEAPAGSAKSTYIAVCYPIRQLIVNRKWRIILGSNALDLSVDRIRAIRNNFENNERLIEDFGYLKPQIPEKWAEKALYIEGADVNGPPSIRAAATGAKIAGKRGDEFIGDDLVDDENSSSELSRKKIKQWFGQMALSRIEPYGLARLINNEYGEFTLMQDMILNRGGQYKEWKCAVYRSLDPKNTGPMGELWVEHWNYERLMARKAEIGTIAFERMYQNNPKAAEGGIFKEKNLQYYTSIPGNLKYYMGIDLAISLREGANYFVILVIGVDPKTENIYVTDIYRKHINFSTQVDEILKHHNKWGCAGIGIGNKSYQEVMPQTLLTIKALPINRINESTPKEARLTKLSLYFENHKIFIKAEQTELIDEYLTYDPDDKNASPDVLDALWMAVETALPAMNRNFVSVVAGENRKRNLWGI